VIGAIARAGAAVGGPKRGGLSNEIGAKIVLAIAVLVRFSRH